MRRFLKENNILITSYDKIAKFRQESRFVYEMQYFHKDFGTPVSNYIPYQFIVEQTIRQIVEDEIFENANYPLTAMLSDGLDGTESHKNYNQVQNHPDLSTKSFLMFAFKVLWIKDSLGNTLWTNPCPNSPFAHRPRALLALGESEDNVKLLMKNIFRS